MKKFGEWLKLRETGTTTADVANFAVPVGAKVEKEPKHKKACKCDGKCDDCKKHKHGKGKK